MQPSDRHCLIITTTGSDALARQISDAIVERGLGACVQRLPISSTYKWEGSIARDSEFLLLIKTRTARVDEIERLISDMHDYAIPEILCVPVIAGSEAYLQWIDGETGL